MSLFKWRQSDAVFVPELDDEHRDVYQAVGELQEALRKQAPASDIHEIVLRFKAYAEEHFQHEEKLMRGFRYNLFEWHKKQHDTMRRRVREYSARLEAGDAEAGAMLVEFVTGWLHDHVAVTDRMMGAFLRNQRRAAHIS